jgi:hypothetical protein
MIPELTEYERTGGFQQRLIVLVKAHKTARMRYYNYISIVVCPTGKNDVSICCCNDERAYLTSNIQSIMVILWFESTRHKTFGWKNCRK